MAAFALGVDLGTTFTAAVVARGTDAHPVTFADGATSIPSVIVVPEQGDVLVGAAAEAAAAANPSRAIREFKRRLGDPVPAVIGGVPYPIELVMAHLLAHAVRTAVAQEGELPQIIVLTHPANWGDYKTGVLREAARRAGLDADRVVLLTEPEAAAITHTREQQMAVGEVIAVYDLGGGTFDAALVRRTASRLELIGNPEGMDRLGGIDFDQAVLAHVDRALGGAVTGADRSNPGTLPAQAALRNACRAAKEALSATTECTIPVVLPALRSEVRLTRAEFEAMIRPRLADTARSLERTVHSAGLTMGQVSRVLLVGGSARMPLVGEVVQAATGRPAVLAPQPKLAIATGAALMGAARLAAPPSPPSPAPPSPAPPSSAPPSSAPPPPAAAPGAPGAPGAESAWQVPERVAPPAPAAPHRRRTTIVAAVAGAVVGVAAILGVVALTGGDEGTTPTTAAPTTGAGVTTAPSTPPGTGSVIVGLGDATLVPASLVADGNGVVVVTTSGAVLRVSATSATPEPGTDAITGAAFAAVAADGSLVVTAPSGVWQVRDGSATLLLDPAAAGLGGVAGPVAFDPAGNLYVADNAHHRIIRRGTDGSLSLVAGNGAVPAPGDTTGDGQRGEAAPVGTVTGLLIDRSGRLVYTDADIPAVRVVDSAGTLSTLLGSAGAPSPIGGIALDASGGVLVAAPGMQQVILIDSGGNTSVISTGQGAVTSVAVSTDGAVWTVDGTTVVRTTR